MIKGKKTLLIVGVVIVVGLVSYLGYQKYVEEYTTVKVREHIQSVFNLDEIARIEYKSNDLITLEKQGEIWSNPEQPNLSYDQDLMAEWIGSLQALETKEVVKNVQDETVYGISDESVMITLYDSMNDYQTIKLGDIIEAEDSVYIKCDEENKLYVLSYEAAKAIFIRPNEFVDCSQVLQVEQLNSITLEKEGQKTVNLVNEEGWKLKDYYAFLAVLNEEEIEDLLQTTLQMQVKNYVGTYEDLKPYGLEEPRFILTLNDETKLAFGNQSGDYVYVTINGENDVYVMEKETYTKFMSFKPFNAINKQVVHVNMSDLESITLINPQGTYELKFNEMAPVEEGLEDENTRSESTEHEALVTKQDEAQQKVDENPVTEVVENEKTIAAHQNLESQEAKEPVVATLNDIELIQSEAQEWLDKIQASIYIEAPLQNPNIEQKEERKAEATINFKLKDQSVLNIKLVPYDINYYILRYNDIVEVAVNKEKVTKLFNELTQFVKK